jgi:hypothetical protein
LPPNARELDIVLGMTAQRVVFHYGIELEGLKYKPIVTAPCKSITLTSVLCGRTDVTIKGRLSDGNSGLVPMSRRGKYS